MAGWKVPTAIAGGVLLAGLLAVGVGVLVDDGSPGASVADAEPGSQELRLTVRVTYELRS